MTGHRAATVVLFLSLLGAPRSAAGGVVISEIHYHPPAGDEALEFVELSNDSSTPEDISGWAFVEGIGYVFPKGTILAGRGSVVLCLDLPAFQARYPAVNNALGNFSGRLDASGERLTLVNHAGVAVQSLRYRDDGKWPVGPDGTGHTLALRRVVLDSGEPESWSQSSERGGTPGKPNFTGEAPTFVDQVFIDVGALWRYQKGNQAFSTPPSAWRDPAFDDSAWTEAPAGFGYGDNDDRTVLSDMLNGYTSVAIRKRFPLTAVELEAPGEFYLSLDFDDGVCASLNGAEVARVNCGAPGEERAFNAVATGSREAGTQDFYRLPRDRLIAGENVLAISGYNFTIGSSDFSLIPRLVLRRVIDPRSAALAPLFLNELFRGASAGSGWVEILNDGPAAVDLTGHRLTDDPERPDPYIFPAGSGIGPRGYLVVGESASGLTLSAPRVRLYLLTPEGLAVTASVFDRPPPPGWVAGAYSEVRFPDGGPLEWVSATPTPLSPNVVARVSDIVINEIFYHPPEERAGEFLELLNRGAAAVDISGFRFDKGIDYTIRDGTVLPPGGFLVVAEDPALLADSHGYQGAQGPYLGQLANDGENVRLIDRAGNPVDEVRYHEGGAWSLWADGRGASLELIDPRQDNSSGAAWDASDESGKSDWERLSFPVPAYAAAAQSELHILHVERGTCLIDDVSITRAGGANHISNPGFETSTAPWVIQGTHVMSRRITTDQHSGAACLELNASGKGDTLVNRIEIETTPRMTAGAYEVSLWTKWLRGGSVLILHGDYTAGAFGGRPSPAVNLSGNSLSAALRMTVPRNLGTPGAENSARLRLREAAGSDNLGPVISAVEHRPPSPIPSQPVSITARVLDADGVAGVRAHHREGAGVGVFNQVELRDDGLSGDGLAGDGLYGGEIPGSAAGIRVVFYVEAADARGVSRRFPLDPSRTCVYQVQGPVGTGIDGGRIVLDTARTSELSSRPLHSNDLVHGTFVWNDDEVYYQVGVRYRGSPWGRPGRNNYRVRFEADRPFHRERKAINLDNSGGGPNEGSAYFLGVRNSGPDKPAPAGDYGYVRTWFNGASIGVHGLLQPVDRDFMTHWYGDANGTLVLKVEGRRMFADSGDLVGWDGASFMYRTTSKEDYRGYFIPGIRRSVDDWQPLIALCKVMDRVATPNAAFDTAVDTVLDVEQFLRCLAPRILQSDWDAFCIGNGHNGFLVLDPRDGRWELLPFDMDNSFGNPSPNLFPASDPDVVRLMGRPKPRRTYFRILQEYVDGYWNAANAGPWLDAVQAQTGVSTGGIKGYLTTSSAGVRTAIRSSTTVPFRILTNAGNPITTPTPNIALEGEAPVQAASLTVARDEADIEVLEPVWTTLNRWRQSFDLKDGENRFAFYGFDSSGSLVGTASTTVHVSSQPVLSITSWSPQSGSTAGGDLVTFQGNNFAAGMRVLFNGSEASPVTVQSPTLLTAVTPPALPPLPADGKVDVELIVSAASRLTLPRGFTYVTGTKFLRGDSNGDSGIELGDAIATLFYLFHGIRVPCLDAADFNDNGRIGLNDATGVLDYLFRAGPPPAPPYPAFGEDTTEDAFRC